MKRGQSNQSSPTIKQRDLIPKGKQKVKKRLKRSQNEWSRPIEHGSPLRVSYGKSVSRWTTRCIKARPIWEVNRLIVRLTYSLLLVLVYASPPLMSFTSWSMSMCHERQQMVKRSAYSHPNIRFEVGAFTVHISLNIDFKSVVFFSLLLLPTCPPCQWT